MPVIITTEKQLIYQALTAVLESRTELFREVDYRVVFKTLYVILKLVYLLILSITDLCQTDSASIDSDSRQKLQSCHISKKSGQFGLFLCLDTNLC